MQAQLVETKSRKRNLVVINSTDAMLPHGFHTPKPHRERGSRTPCGRYGDLVEALAGGIVLVSKAPDGREEDMPWTANQSCSFRAPGA